MEVKEESKREDVASILVKELLEHIKDDIEELTEHRPTEEGVLAYYYLLRISELEDAEKSKKLWMLRATITNYIREKSKLH